MVARVVNDVAAIIVHRRHRRGHWEESGLEEGTVLGGAATFESHTTGSVSGDRQEPRHVGGALLPRELALELAVLGVGVDHVQEMAPGPGQLAGVEDTGVPE